MQGLLLDAVENGGWSPDELISFFVPLMFLCGFHADLFPSSNEPVGSRGGCVVPSPTTSTRTHAATTRRAPTEGSVRDCCTRKKRKRKGKSQKPLPPVRCVWHVLHVQYSNVRRSPSPSMYGAQSLSSRLSRPRVRMDGERNLYGSENATPCMAPKGSPAGLRGL